MSANGRNRCRRLVGSAGACIGVRMSEKKIPDTTNDNAFAMKAASRPNVAANRPPMAAPTASITPQVEPRSALAFESSSSSRAMLGIAACEAGPTTAARADTVLWNTKANHTVSAPTNSNPSAARAWKPDTTTRMRRRSNRSAIGPAIGDAKNEGNENDTITIDTRKLESVRSLMRPTSATKENQSPMYEMT